jgi:hypothetical protein
MAQAHTDPFLACALQIARSGDQNKLVAYLNAAAPFMGTRGSHTGRTSTFNVPTYRRPRVEDIDPTIAVAMGLIPHPEPVSTATVQYFPSVARA